MNLLSDSVVLMIRILVVRLNLNLLSNMVVLLSKIRDVLLSVILLWALVVLLTLILVVLGLSINLLMSLMVILSRDTCRIVLDAYVHRNGIKSHMLGGSLVGLLMARRSRDSGNSILAIRMVVLMGGMRIVRSDIGIALLRRMSGILHRMSAGGTSPLVVALGLHTTSPKFKGT